MYDLAIIGAGWAGFNAAIRAKELGKKVCILESGLLGGACLNRGCIPTKALIQSAKIYSLTQKSKTFGVMGASATFNMAAAQERKDALIRQLRQGMQFMLKGVDMIEGPARLRPERKIESGGQVIEAGRILIACGSRPAELGALKFDAKKIISSDQILELKEVPSSLLVVGGGVIGCEFAGLFNALGSRVTIVEKMPQLLPGLDSQVAAKILAAFKKKGIQVETSADAAEKNLDDYSLVLVCVGRAANTDGLGLEQAGIKTDRGRIVVDQSLATNVDGIYAAGDCASSIMLAHWAAYQGRLAAENIFGAKPAQDRLLPVVPSCIFSDPEIGTAGMTEDQARSAGRKITVHRFDFLGSGMARIIGETEGFVKVITDAKTREILGGSIIGPRAAELIAVLCVAISNHLKAEQVGECIFAHPTLSEGLAEALRNKHGV